MNLTHERCLHLFLISILRLSCLLSTKQAVDEHTFIRMLEQDRFEHEQVILHTHKVEKNNHPVTLTMQNVVLFGSYAFEFTPVHTQKCMYA